jgi:carbonic anhydrase
MDCNEALQRLKAGNVRFVEGKSVHPHRVLDWRRQRGARPRPLATILACSDALVVPELIFDQGFGDLFVIRVAGNVVAPDVLGSMQYAGAHLGTGLFLVMGHEECGAVQAALLEKSGKAPQPGRIEALIRLIHPALADVDETADGPTVLNAAVEANVRWSLRQLLAMPGARKAVEGGRALILGAVCEIDTGRVRFLD